ncbi:endo-1,4-beta-xylanase [Rhodopseudomonas palustris]|uniref:Beta-xylanase n=1 Tax=Rhodopseudomonas palustris (strain BisB18) TaxID=316056 RepID=Q21BJ6_RHOPB
MTAPRHIPTSSKRGVTRRQLLRTAPAAALLALASPGARAAAIRPRRKIPYGAAVALDDLRGDPRLGAALAGTCSQIVPVSELKWSELRPAPGQFAFEKADALAGFAADNGLAMRGHTLVWYAALPDWTKEIDSEAAAERALREHIETVVSRYRGRIRSWDVVNEVIPDEAHQPTDRRPSLWSRYLGERYIPLAFRIAAEADPKAQLVLNDYDIEFGDPRCRRKRAAFRHLIRQLQDADVPIHAVGLQCHLHGEMAVDRAGLESFVAELHGNGLKCLVTELDVMDQHLPAPVQRRDALVAAQVGELLAAVTAPGPLDALLTWGISDRYSWIPYAAPRADKRPNRPLPLDREFQRKPFMDVIDQFTGREA